MAASRSKQGLSLTLLHSISTGYLGQAPIILPPQDVTTIVRQANPGCDQLQPANWPPASYRGPCLERTRPVFYACAPSPRFHWGRWQYRWQLQAQAGACR